MDKIRVLHLIPNLVKGGAQRIALDICNELQTRPEVKVALLYWEGKNQFEFLSENLEVHQINIQYELSFSRQHRINISEYEAFVDDFKPDIIHTHLYPAELVSRENSRKDISYFTHCHDNMRQLEKWSLKTLASKQKSVEYLERKRLMIRYRVCNNQFISISKDVLLYLNNNVSKNLLENIHLLPNGFNYQAFFQEVKSNLSYPVRLINVGNFIPKKNQQFLLEVQKQLNAEKVNTELTFIGDGTTFLELKEKSKIDGVQNVHFAGRRDDVASLLKESYIYVHSALYEPFGLVILEAMAAGLPVVSLDGMGNRDLIQDDINGLIVEQDDIQTFVKHIKDLIKDRKLYSRIALNGQESAKKHDIRFYTDQLIQLYTNAIRRGTVGR